MSLRKRIASLAISATLVLGSINLSFADSARVVTLGANLSEAQKSTILKYFGVNESDVVVLEVNNQEERQYLEGIASESQIGNKTYSCAYVEPTKEGSGLNIKTANITWVKASMVATTLSTAGMTDANVVIAANFPVSGTGALTGIMKAFEDATGEKLDEEKKELATEELVTTGQLGEDDTIGQDKATGIVNDIKTEIIKNGTSDTTQIADTIINVTNNYNVSLTEEQKQQLEDLMVKISAQNYDYNKMKDALNDVKDTVSDNLESMGIKIDKGFFETITGWFSDLGTWVAGIFDNAEGDLGILNNTDDSALGENAVIDATDKEAINLPSTEEVEGFFGRIWNWFTGLFNSDSSDPTQEPTTSTEPTVEEPTLEEPTQEPTTEEPLVEEPSGDAAVDALEENSTVEENVQPETTTE